MAGRWICGNQRMDIRGMAPCRMGKALRAHQLHSIPKDGHDNPLPTRRWARFALPILRVTIANWAEVHQS